MQEETAFAAVRGHPLVAACIRKADRYLESLGYTEHGECHVTTVARTAQGVLRALGYGARDVGLAGIAGYLHDCGNFLGREGHPAHGAMIALEVLRELRFPAEDIAEVMEAIANHDEKHGFVAGPVGAAVTLADKADARRSRVRAAPADFDIHDRVNWAVEGSRLDVDARARGVTLVLEIDATISKPMEYFEIFLPRMTMCRQAAARLDAEFHLSLNGAMML